MIRARAAVARHPRHLVALAIALGLAMAELPPVGQACAAAVAALAAMAMGSRAHVALAICAACVAAGAAGQVRLATIDADPLGSAGGAPAAAGGQVRLRGYLLEHPRERPYGVSFRARVEAATGERQVIEVRSATGLPPTAAIGDEFVAAGTLGAVDAGVRSKVAGSAAARNYARFLMRNGVRRRLRARSLELTGRRRDGLTGWIDGVRRRSERTLAIGLRPEAAALLRGMVLGGDDGIPEPTVQAFKVSGLAHVLAVSGQNVLLLVILVQAIAVACGAGRLPRLLIPVVLICIYVPLCGAQASVVRAGVMGLAGLVAMLASRPSSRLYALLLGAIAVLAWNPRWTADVGSQLSFAAVAGIMAFARPVATRLGRWPSWAAEALAMTVGATIATAPLMAYHFGVVSIVSPAANVIGAPLMGPIVWLGSLAAAIGQFSSSAGALLNAPNEFLLGCLITVAHTAASVPGAQFQAPGVGVTGTALSVAAIVVAGLAVNGALPAPIRRISRRRTVAIVLCAIVPVAAPLADVGAESLFGRRSPVPPRPSIVFLDVGQGDAVLLLGAGGCEALIDGGPPGRDLPDRLNRMGIERLELAVATHAQLDHDGGLGEIAASGDPEVQIFLDGGGPAPGSRFSTMRERLRRGGTRIASAERGTVWRCGGLRLEVVAPEASIGDPSARTSPRVADPNARSVVALAEAGGLRMLASGDAESPSLLPLPLRPVDVLKVSHHGSADPGLAALLARVGPRLAVIGVGADNRYGHPAAPTLSALEGHGVPVYRTDRDGSVVISRRGDRIAVSPHAERSR